MLWDAADNLQAGTGLVVGVFPGTGFGLPEQGVATRVEDFEPFTMGAIK